MPFVASYENSRSRTEGAGSVTWIATFADGGREYIAIGRDRNQMAVFRADTRSKIAIECCLGSKNAVKSEVFCDLNIYPRAAVHARRVVRDQPRVLPFLSKGAALRFTAADMQRLFELLVDELNRLCRDYYRTNANFSLSRRLNI